MRNIAISCECGWVGITPSYAESTADHLFHQLSNGDGHSALTYANVPERMSHPELSVLRQVASQDALDYRALQTVNRREAFRLRRSGEPMLSDTDDGLGCARGCINALAILAAAIIVAVAFWAVWLR
jgi:hypothetical protein